MAEWREIADFPGYLVSSDGEVMGPRGNIIRSRPKKNGYRLITFPGPVYRYVHHLVLLAFVGPRPLGLVALHADDDRLNNRASNLSWGTQKQNMADADRNGRLLRGEDHASAKITQQQMQAIRERCAAGERQADVGACYGLTQPAVSMIVTGRNWRDAAPR